MSAPLLNGTARQIFQDPSFYAQWEIMHEASGHVKFVVDGQGGDEVFGGYPNYRATLLTKLISEKRALSF